MARFPFPFPRPRPHQPRRRYPRRVGLIGALALLIAAIAGGMQQCQHAPAAGPPAAGQQPATTSQAPAPVRRTQASLQRQAAASHLSVPDQPPVHWAVLDGPPITDIDQVRGIWDTLRRIVRGPPFPHRQDGVPFQNRENRLPQRESGWWREYTVETPGSPDRGARRLVVGSDGEAWYSPDHYRTFHRLLLP